MIFDLGRVMIHICDHWKDAARKAKVTWTDEIAARFDAAADEINGPLLTAFETGKINASEFSKAVSKQTDVPASDIMAMFKAWICKPCKGVDRIVKGLKKAGIRTACLSNTHHMHWEMMSQPGPHNLKLDQLDFRFASHEVGLSKPDPEIYQHVRRKTGIKPDRILFFDDLQANCQAAQEAKWQTKKIIQGRPVYEQIRQTLKQYKLVIAP